MNFVKGLGLGLLIGYSVTSTIANIIMYQKYVLVENNKDNAYGSYGTFRVDPTLAHYTRDAVNAHTRNNYTAD